MSLLTLVTLSLISKGPPPRQKEKSRARKQEREKVRRKSSFLGFDVDQTIMNFKDDSGNNA